MGTTTHAPMPSDPIHAVITAHRAAWDAFQVAPVGEHAERAETALDDALSALLTTPCETQFGTIALLTHLRWWLTEERDFADAYQPAYDIAVARASDLAMLLGGQLWPGAVNIDGEPEAGPDRLGSVALGIVRRLAAKIPFNSTAAGEVVTAIGIIIGGIYLTGLASLL